MVWGELLCCLAAFVGPLGAPWKVLGDPWSLALAVLWAFLGTSWRSLGGSGPPLMDFVDFPATLKIIEKTMFSCVFGSMEITPASFMGGPALLRPAVLIKKLLGAVCGRLAVARAAFNDL